MIKYLLWRRLSLLTYQKRWQPHINEVSKKTKIERRRFVIDLYKSETLKLKSQKNKNCCLKKYRIVLTPTAIRLINKYYGRNVKNGQGKTIIAAKTGFIGHFWTICIQGASNEFTVRQGKRKIQQVLMTKSFKMAKIIQTGGISLHNLSLPIQNNDTPNDLITNAVRLTNLTRSYYDSELFSK